MTGDRAGATAVVVLAVGAVFTMQADAAAAAPENCRESITDYCVEDEVTNPGSPAPQNEGSAGPPDDAGESRQVQAPAPQCTWVRDPGTIAGGDGPGSVPDVGVRPAEEAYLIFERCGDELTGRVRWATPADPQPSAAPAPAPPAPEVLASRVRVRLEGNLPDPVVHTSPAVGEPAVVNHPTFLALDNWTGTVTDRECAGALCVTVTATPVLTWDPGEPEARTLTCQAGGTRYDPAGPPPDQQAARPGACAHAYQARTATGDRPPEWPGTATVTWTLTWTSTTGAAGTLPAITRTTSVPRAVEEVQALVVR